MSETRTVNQGWVKLNLPKKESNTKIRTKKPDWIRVKLPIVKNIHNLDLPLRRMIFIQFVFLVTVLIWGNAGLKELLHL